MKALYNAKTNKELPMPLNEKYPVLLKKLRINDRG